MALNSLHFIVLFFVLLVVLLVLQLGRKKSNEKNDAFGWLQLLTLLTFSLFFLVACDWRFCACAVIYTGAVFVCGILEQSTKHSRAVMIIGVVGSIIMLGYFKYSNFFLASFAALLGENSKTLNIILPLGISFYTFTGISYLIDVYRSKYPAERNFLYFALYMLFFGKMTAGPIVRADSFLPQARNYRGVQWNKLLAGVQIFVFGLFKKIVLADHLSVFVNDVFHAPAAYNSFSVILGVVSYSLQIYFDFSGYSDMAIGVAKMVGFDFEPNFNLPYLASNISEFWKRWHISLSSWLQDYLYIPLGGSKKGRIRTYLNLMLVMLISGLWHGAGVTFLIWGGFHGVVSCVNRLVKENRTSNALPKWCGILGTYVLVALLWVPFRADNIEIAMAVWKGVFSLQKGIVQPYTWTFFAILCLLGSTAFAVYRAKKADQPYINGYYPVLDLSRFCNLVLFFTFTGLTVLMGYFGNTAFIYGKF